MRLFGGIFTHSDLKPFNKLTYHEKSLLHKLKLRDKLLLLYLQLLHSLTGFISALIVLPRLASCPIASLH